jgi:hypothetical protein
VETLPFVYLATGASVATVVQRRERCRDVDVLHLEIDVELRFGDIGRLVEPFTPICPRACSW